MKDVVDNALSQFRPKLTCFHGPAHWARVLMNGRLLAAETGADLQVVELFAILHDCKRKNQHEDPGHGKRAATFAETLRGLLFELDDEAFNSLYDAIAYHEEAGDSGNITMQTCWDADRLDLGRMKKFVDPDILCTEAARDIFDAAHARASNREVPAFVQEEWGLSFEVKKKSSWF